MRSIRWLWVVILVLGVVSFSAEAQDARAPFKLIVQYIEFPPYYYTNSDLKPDGFLLKMAAAAFAKAGVEVVYESLPAKRVLRNIHSDNPICSIGWYKTAERELFVKFSRKIYQDRPIWALFLKKNMSLFEGRDTLAGLVQDKSLTLGMLKGYSQGSVVDGIIETGKPVVQCVTDGYPGLVRMLAEEYFMYILGPPEGMGFLIKKNHLNPALFAHKALADVPAGNARYIIYSRGVPDAVIHSIDKALGTVLKSKKK